MPNNGSRTADSNVFEDLSGTSSSPTGNPYHALIQACEDDLVSFCLNQFLTRLRLSSYRFNCATKPTENYEIPSKNPNFFHLSSPAWS